MKYIERRYRACVGLSVPSSSPALIVKCLLLHFTIGIHAEHQEETGARLADGPLPDAVVYDRSRGVRRFNLVAEDWR